MATEEGCLTVLTRWRKMGEREEEELFKGAGQCGCSVGGWYDCLLFGLLLSMVFALAVVSGEREKKKERRDARLVLPCSPLL